MKGGVEYPINGQKSPSACARARESLPQWGKGFRQPGCAGRPETRSLFAPSNGGKLDSPHSKFPIVFSKLKIRCS